MYSLSQSKQELELGQLQYYVTTTLARREDWSRQTMAEKWNGWSWLIKKYSFCFNHLLGPAYVLPLRAMWYPCMCKIIYSFSLTSNQITTVQERQDLKFLNLWIRYLSSSWIPGRCPLGRICITGQNKLQGFFLLSALKSTIKAKWALYSNPTLTLVPMYLSVLRLEFTEGSQRNKTVYPEVTELA